jgi:hypothetical protein
MQVVSTTRDRGKMGNGTSLHDRPLSLKQAWLGAKNCAFAVAF